jgi:tetratricopeptide (TPR) repeat protein
MNNSKHIVQIILIGLIILGLYECVIGILQLIGTLPSGHILYPATGTFFNPGPYCGFIATLMPLAIHYILVNNNKFIYTLAIIYFFIGLLILPILFGRTGWIAAIIGCGYVYLKHHKIRLQKWHIIVVIFVACISAISLYLLKPASALGRVFLYKLGIDAFQENAIYGVGWDNVAGAIGNAQEIYFKNNPNSIFVAVAGSPEYAFNEFLQIAIAYGIIAIVAFILLFTLNFIIANKNKEYGLAGSILAAAIVCMASYPLQFNEFILMFAAILITTTLLLHKANVYVKAVVSSFIVFSCCVIVWQNTQRHNLLEQWQLQKLAYQYNLSERNMHELDSLHKKMYWSKNFLFDYGKVLRKNHLYKRSIIIMQEGTKISSDPMFLNLIGKNYYDLKQYNSAESYFKRSINRLPGRLYPYYLLAKLYTDSCFYNVEQFKNTYNAAMQLTPKVQSPAVRQMRSELKLLNDSVAKLETPTFSLL